MMNKYIISTAAFLLAGTALSGAATVLTDSVFELHGTPNLSSNYTSDVSLSSKDGTRAQFTLTTVFDWSFIQENVTESVLGAVQIHASESGKTGFGFYQNADGNIIASGMNGSESHVNSGSVDISSFVKNDLLVLTMVITNDGGTLYGYNANSDELVTLASSTIWKYTVSNYNKLWFSNPMGGSVEDVYVFSTKSETDGVLTISQQAFSAAIPEPSAFGLLAGLGALALVAARRRRSHKAA